jgi:hypothetical protein
MQQRHTFCGSSQLWVRTVILFTRLYQCKYSATRIRIDLFCDVFKASSRWLSTEAHGVSVGPSTETLRSQLHLCLPKISHQNGCRPCVQIELWKALESRIMHGAMALLWLSVIRMESSASCKHVRQSKPSLFFRDEIG